MVVNRHVTASAHQGGNFMAGKLPTTTLKKIISGPPPNVLMCLMGANSWPIHVKHSIFGLVLTKSVMFD